jgi:hypothetical protein
MSTPNDRHTIRPEHRRNGGRATARVHDGVLCIDGQPTTLRAFAASHGVGYETLRRRYAVLRRQPGPVTAALLLTPVPRGRPQAARA